MAIQISGCTVIDNSRNITNANNMCVGTGITMIGSSGNISIAGTLTAAGVVYPLQVISFNPTDDQANVNLDTNPNVAITFDRSIQKGTGNVTIRNGSAIGTILATIGIASTSVTISGSIATIFIASDIREVIPVSTNIFVVIDAGAFSQINSTDSMSKSNLIDTYNFTTSGVPPLGSSYQGGFLICKSSPVRWVVAPSSSQVSRTWYARADANTRAKQVSGCTGWFIPTTSQLQNPGYICRSFWDSFSGSSYWTNDPGTFHDFCACAVNFATGGSDEPFKSTPLLVRAFRCVTY
jgi:hypothetical protein